MQYREHGFSVMVLLIHRTEGLFYSLRKDNDNLCNTLCCNMHVWLDSIFFPFSLGFRMKKSHTLAREIGQLKSSICFSFWKCSHLIVHEGLEESYLYTQHTGQSELAQGRVCRAALVKSNCPAQTHCWLKWIAAACDCQLSPVCLWTESTFLCIICN